MWQAFKEVIRDLNKFWLGRSANRESVTMALESPKDELLTSTAVLQTEVAALLQHIETPKLMTDKSLPQVSVSPQSLTEAERFEWLHVPLYLSAAPTHIYSTAAPAVDSCVATLPYASKVRGGERTVKWVEVSYGDGESGWVRSDQVAEHKAEVFPNLQPAEYYAATHPETHKLRQCIGDMFSHCDLGLPLQANEFVWYCWWRDGRTIKWPHHQGRVAGAWHQLLRGAVGVHIGVTPKAQSVLETVAGDESARLGYVAAVYPDDSISVLEVRDGYYHSFDLTVEEWRELKPVFIAVT